VEERVNFEKSNGLIPAIVQDSSNDKVLMLGYMNRESLIQTLLTGKTHFWSRTRKKLWMKGEESGHFSLVQNVILDCDYDTILVKVQQIGPICHTNQETCFHYPTLKEEETKPTAAILERIYEIILERSRTGDEGSYVKKLMDKGESAVVSKISEESEEVILATKEGPERLVSEESDLIFHLMVLLASKDIKLQEIFNELDRRHKEKMSKSS
jgi:phosphoribosyl-ATP pyrophosphohydrolase/phosphoribosyl-AMP cyclohydrolase